MPEYGYVPSRRTPGQLADVAEGATKSLEQATQLIKDIRAGKGTVGKLFTDEALYRDVQGFVDAAETVAQSLRAGRGTLGQLLNNDAAYRSLEASLRNLQAMTTRINAGEGSLGKLLNDPAFANSLTSTTGEHRHAHRPHQPRRGHGGQARERSRALQPAEFAGRAARHADDALNEGQGTAGQLLHDKQLYDNLNSAATEMRGWSPTSARTPRSTCASKSVFFSVPSDVGHPARGDIHHVQTRRGRRRYGDAGLHCRIHRRRGGGAAVRARRRGTRRASS